MTHELFKTKRTINAWLKKYKISSYTLVPDLEYGFVVNVASGVNLQKKDLTHIPVKFNHVEGYFNCMNNKLTSLKGCPETVGDYFACAVNQLTSLEYCPQQVAESFFCYDNQIVSLEYCPKIVGEMFSCGDNVLLGDAQEIHDFNEIYKIHSAIVDIKKEKELLGNSIITNPQDPKRESFKI